MTRCPVDLYQRVAELHVANIGDGFLSTLGTRFLKQLYAAIDASPAGVLCLAERDERIVGFVAGAARTRTIFSALLPRTAQVVLALLPRLLYPRSIVKLSETLLAALIGPRLAGAPAAELLSIAVDPQFRGQGIAAELYAALSGELRERQVAAFRIVVGERLAAANAFYLKMGATPIGWAEVHSGERSTIYVQNLHQGRES